MTKEITAQDESLIIFLAEYYTGLMGRIVRAYLPHRRTS